jgi:chemotaxis response regulator CheB
MMGPRIRVMIVDDHDRVRSRLAVQLAAHEDLDLVGTASSGEEAIELCDRIEADVVLMSLIMSSMDGITATWTLRQRHPRLEVVALIDLGQEELLEETMKAGAAGYLCRNGPIGDLAETIRAAAAGDSTALPDKDPRGTVSAPLSLAPGGAHAEECKPPTEPNGNGLAEIIHFFSGGRLDVRTAQQGSEPSPASPKTDSIQK